MKIDKSPLTSSTSLNYELIWERAWRMDLETQGGKKIAIDSNDNIYQTGYWLLESINQVKVILIKRDSTGNKIWSITWGYDESENGRDVAVDSDDNIYVCGSTQNSVTGYSDMFLVKFDALGNELWNNTRGKIERTSGEAIAIDSDNNIYFVGQGRIEGSTTDIIIIKYNSSGSIIWERIWDSYDYDWAEDVCVDSQNNVCITGHLGFNLVVIKYNSSGSELWYRTWDQGDHAYGKAIDTDSNDNVFIGGFMDYRYSGIINSSLILLKYNSSGFNLWDKIYYDGNGTKCYDMVVDSNGFMFLSGVIIEEGFKESVYISIYDWDGNQVWNDTWGYSSFSNGYGIDIDSLGNVYISGYTNIYQEMYDESFLLRYSKTKNLEIPSIPGYNQLFLIGIICFILVIFLKMKFLNNISN